MAVVTLGGANEISRGLSSTYMPLLNFHLSMNLIGFFAGMVHGYIFSNSLEPITLSLAIVMTNGDERHNTPVRYIKKLEVLQQVGARSVRAYAHTCVAGSSACPLPKAIDLRLFYFDYMI